MADNQFTYLSTFILTFKPSFKNISISPTSNFVQHFVVIQSRHGCFLTSERHIRRCSILYVVVLLNLACYAWINMGYFVWLCKYKVNKSFKLRSSLKFKNLDILGIHCTTYCFIVHACLPEIGLNATVFIN